MKMHMSNMELHFIIHYLPLLLVLLAVEAYESNTSETESSRAPRSSRRVVRLYSGTRPEPIACLGEGLQSDPVNCAVFYRCMKSGRGRYMSFKFQCAPGTIFDPDTQGCNHPSAVKRSDCGIDHGISVNEQIHDNAIENIKQELPSPITTKLPPHLWSTFSQRQDLSTLFPWLTSTHNNNKIHSFSTDQPIHRTSNYAVTGQNAVTGQAQTRKQRSTTPKVSPVSRKPSAQIGDLCTVEGFMGDSENCRKFYRCINNLRGGYIRYEFMCTESTIWDDDIQSCNHAWAVKKRRCGRGNINEVSDELNNKDESNDDSTKKVTPNNNLVQQTISVSQTQGSSSYFTNNPLTTVNNSAATTTTKNPVTPNYYVNERHTHDYIRSTEKRITSQNDENDVSYNNMNTKHDEPSSSNECSENGFMGDKNDCKKFYRCVDNGRGSYTKYEFSCGDGTVWDANIESCNHAWAVKECGGKGSTKDPGTSITTISTVTTATSTKSTPSYITTVQITTDEDDSNGYGNQHQETISTKTESSSTLSTTPFTRNPENNCQSSGFIGDENDCKKFYRCVDKGNGDYTRYEFSCGEGTVWDTEIEACNHPWAVQKCGGSSSSTTEKFTPSTTIKETYTTQSIGLTQNDDSDSGYGIQHDDENTSPPDDTSSPSITITTTKRPHNSSNNCISTGFIGDNFDCKKFYRCVDNGYGGFTRYEFSCGEGTVWDSTIQSCNHVWAVEKCGGNMWWNNDINKEDVSSGTTIYSSTTTTTSYENEIDTGYGQSSSQSTTATSTDHPFQGNEVPTNECKYSGFMADKKNCKKFYRCVDNGNGGYTRYEFICGEGTIWDQEIQACNHENGRLCDEQGVESTKEPENNNSTESTNESLSTTNSIKTTTMATTESNQIQSSATDSANDTCNSEGFYANSMDCKKFYRCVNNGKGGYTKYDFSCGEGTMWVQDIQACDHQDGNSNCSSYTTKPQQSEDQQSTIGQQSSPVTSASMIDSTDKPNDEYQDNPSNESTQENDNCSSEGFYPNSKDCKKFYRCVDNGQGSFTKYDFSCGEGTAWDTDIQTCNHISEVARCHNESQEENQNQPIQDEGVSQTPESNGSTTDKTTAEPSESNQISSKDSCESEGYFGNKQDCKKFYRCVDNGNGGYTKYDFDCGEGTIWDQDITTCNHPQDVVNPSCNQQSETTSSSSSSTQSTNIDNTTQPPTNCSQDSTTKKPVNQNITCEKAGFYANPNDCKKFYRCVDWDGNGEKFSVYHFECGEGTIWDPSLDTCNHEESVYPPRNCSEIQSQNENNIQESSTSQQTTETTTEYSTTTEQSTTTEKMTTQMSTTSEHTTTQETTTQSTTTEGTTTQQSTTTESATTEQQTTTDSTTTQQPITTESTTTQQTTTTEGTTTSTTAEDNTTPQTTTTEETQQTTTEKATQSTTTESTTTQQTTTAEGETNTTTEQSTTDESTTQQSTTSQTSTTDSSETTEGSTTTEESAENQSSTTESTSTTEQKEDESTTESSSTEGTSSEKECPDTDEDQYLYVCPTSFRRHPKYCNMFYQCTEDDENHEPKIAVFTCPNNTIYDESKTQCVEETKAEKKCNGQIAQRRRIKRFEPYYKEPIIVGNEKYSCSSTGYYPFEKSSECSPAFFKCQTAKSGHLRGFVHKCPEGYLYWSISKRCERKENIKDCKTSSNDWSRRWEIPVERKNIAL